MKKYYSKFLSVIDGLKNKIKSSNDWATEANLSHDAVTKGDFDEFKKNLNPKNPLLNFGQYGVDVAINGSYELFLQVEKAGIESNLITPKFYENAFNWSFARDNLDIVKNLIDRKQFSPQDINDSLFKSVIQNEADKIFTYMLYDLNYQVNNNLHTWLQQQPAPEAISKIEKRNLFFELNEKVISDAPKKNRPKI